MAPSSCTRQPGAQDNGGALNTTPTPCMPWPGLRDDNGGLKPASPPRTRQSGARDNGSTLNTTSPPCLPQSKLLDGCTRPKTAPPPQSRRLCARDNSGALNTTPPLCTWRPGARDKDGALSHCHGCDLNAPIFALFLRIFILCFRAATVVAKYGLFSARLQHVHGLYLV
jgi:hypothetical protein